VQMLRHYDVRDHLARPISDLVPQAHQ
jgi:hypothetical protein